jgi:hypothetical protein
MTTTARTSGDLVQISRAEQRKQRLRELETEQAAEEAEALKMTEEQRQTLLKPFTSVKVEFTDLDGLRWSQTALHSFPSFHRNTPLSTTSHSTSENNAFVILTNADLANFSAEDTIRVSASSIKLRPSYPGQQASTPDVSTSLPESPRRHRDGGRSRSPIKGVFQSEPRHVHGDSNSFLHPIDTPYLDHSNSSNGNVIPVEADNGFVAKHKEGVVSRGRRKRVKPPGLLPVNPSESRVMSPPAVPKVPFPLKDRTASSVLSKSALVVHSFVAEPPCQIYSPQRARVRLHSLLNGTIPPRPVPFPVEPDTTPSPFLLSSATFGNDTGLDIASIAGDISEDDETPTTSPIMEAGADWFR